MDRLSRKKSILARMRRLEDELATLSKYPEDSEFEVGDVITFTMRFNTYGPMSKPYFYAAIKGTDGLWSTTGPRSPKSYSWERMIDWFEDNHISNLVKLNTREFVELI